MALEPNGPAPYAPAPTVLTVIRRFREIDLPEAALDADLLHKINVTESLQRRTLHTLRLLELIDESGKPTAEFQAISKAHPSEYPSTLAEHLRSVYQSVFALVGQSVNDVQAVQNAFWGYTPKGQRDNMVRLFLGLCAEAGIVEQRPTLERAEDAKRRSSPKAGPSQAKAPKAKVYGGAASGVDDLPSGLLGLLSQIPRKGESWTQERRDKFLAAFAAVLDFTIPVDDSPASDFDPFAFEGEEEVAS